MRKLLTALSLLCAFGLFSVLEAREIKVMFANSLTSETSTVQPYFDWYMALNKQTTTLQDLYIEGWRLVQVVKLNAVASDKQFWIFLEKQ